MIVLQLHFYILWSKKWGVEYSEQLNRNVALATQLENVEIFILNTWDKETGEMSIDNDAFNNLID